jgi:hypothetical protein
MWLNVCRTRLETFRERLNLDDTMAEVDATWVRVGARSGRATDEPRSSSR